jgi:hypothetical protein
MPDLLWRLADWRELTGFIIGAGIAVAGCARLIDAGAPHSKDELDAYHFGAPPNDFANPMLPAFEKREFETIRDN